MTGEAVRFTDRDVKEHPNLLGRAVEYVRDYHGEFDFLVTARELERVTGTLPIAVARGVLNCMRVDPRVAGSLPTPQHPSMQSSDLGVSFREAMGQVGDAAQAVNEVLARPRLKLVPPPRPYQVRLRSTIKAPLMWSSYNDPTNLPTKVHDIDHHRSYCVLKTETGELLLHAQARCGYLAIDGKATIGWLEDAEGRVMCKSCERQVLKG